MALYASPNSPGDWKSFTRRNDISKLSLTEQRKKYLQETLQFEDFMAQQAYLQSMSLNSQTNQLHQGGNSDNKVKSIAFAGGITTVSGYTSYVDVTFKYPVSIKAGGVPFIAITNGKQGNGTGSPINYVYNSGVNSSVLRFASSQVAGNNLGAVAANVLGASKVLSLAGAQEPVDADPGTFANVTYTNGASAGITSTFDVTITSGGILSQIVDDLLASITVNPTNCKNGATSNVALTTITGTGASAQASIGTTGLTGGTITGIVITNIGSGYAVGDELQIPVGALGTGQLVTGGDLLSQTTTAGIGNVTGPFTMAISSTSAVGAGGTITLTGDGANALTAVSVSSIGTGYVNGEVLTISNADLVTAGFAGATGNVDITLSASDVQDSTAATITLTAGDFVTGITAVTSGIAGENWAPGDVITFADASFGATSTGGSILIFAGDLTGDVLTLVGSSIDENGAEIYSSANNPGAQLDLSYTSTDTVTAVAS
tara:strand:+ start:1534 stop:3000 length:1467 start_codon:yes stop_codon:yes gene_type:complete